MILDFQQTAAVMSPHRNTLVLAGAGSGKTRVLVERIAHLIHVKKVSPYEIMALTFTRKAANEMAERLKVRIGKEAHHVKVGTIHALALKFIRMYGDALGIRPGSVTVYGPWEEEFLLDDTAKLVKAKPKYREVFKEYYQTGVPPKDDSPHRRIFDVFMNRLRSHNSLTFGMLLTSMASLMPQITKRTISHVLVDEAQDIDLLQWQIIRAFQALRPSCSLFVVADQDQSVYEWRGAVPSYISALQHSFEIFRLENNYRSVEEVVRRANTLVEKNERRLPKTMHAHRADPGSVAVMYEMDSKATAELIASMVGNNGHSHIAVLSRTHKLLESLSRALTERGVEHHYCGRTAKVMDTEAFRRVHALFKLVRNPFDDFAFSLVRPFLGVTDEQFFEILEGSLERYESHFQTWSSMAPKDHPMKVLFDEADRKHFASLVGQLSAMAGSEFDTSVAFSIAKACADKGMTLDHYLDWVATYDIQEDVESPAKEIIQLMTIHAAKGLEFPTVIVIGMNEGILPTKQAIARGDVEEERRLAYVAITRAENSLLLLVRPEESGSEERKFKNPVSRFMSELKA